MDHGGAHVLGHAHEALLQRFRQTRGGDHRLARSGTPQAVAQQIAAPRGGHQQEDGDGSTKDQAAHGLHSN